jgi:hypothetical protein
MLVFYMVRLVGKLFLVCRLRMSRVVAPLVKSRFDLNMTVHTEA